MTRLSHRTTCFSALIDFLIKCTRVFVAFVVGSVGIAAALAATPTSTTTTLTISSTSIPYQTPITLTATVTAGGNPITAGIVLFCDATATYCENNSALGIAQLTSPGATASIKLGSGPIGNHRYKAVFKANENYTSSVSNTVTYSVTGTYSSITGLTYTGLVGNYTLDATITGANSLSTGPTGTISFLDTSTGDSLLGTETLTVSTLSTTFLPLPPFAIGNITTVRSKAIASAYLDTDNNLDVVSGDQSALGILPTISVLLGRGDGTFNPAVTYPGCSLGQSAVQIVLADFNRDGTTDIALACTVGPGSADGGLIIILGKGDGTFYPPTYYPTGDAISIAIGDFNSDGLFDIVLTNRTQSTVNFFIGNGDGTFVKEATTLSATSFTQQIVVADFNEDGFDDVAYSVSELVNDLYSDLYISLGNGKGAFPQPTTPVATQIGEFLTAGDTNGDNHVDIVSSSDLEPDNNEAIGNSLFVLLGTGTGTFRPTATYLSDIPSDPHLTDVNGDGIPDIIAGGSYGALVYQGNGDGTFQPYQEPTIGNFSLTYAVNAGDYNNDGNADLIGTDVDSPRAAVSLSQVTQTSSASALANVAVFPLGSGVHNVDASYSGDSVYIGSVSPTVSLTAAAVNTSLVLTASPASATLAGESVALTAALSPYTVGPPTTTTDNDIVDFSTGAIFLGSAKLSSGIATLNTTSLPVGADPVIASFIGDSNYNPSMSNTVSATVSNILISSSLNPSTYTQAVTFTATLLPGKTGTVTFFDGTSNIGTGTVSNAVATLSISTLVVGSHNITAKYNSDISAVLAQVVNKETPQVNVSTSGPSVYGAPVTITASVPSDATGTIMFTSGSLVLGSGAVASGSVSIVTSILTVPTDAITATYSGDGNYNTATGSTTQTVSKASPASALTSSTNPSLIGSSITFTDTLPVNVTGTVSFTSGSTVLGSSSVTNGVATLSIATLPVGSDPVTATYSGDTNDNTSIAGLTQVVNKDTPVVTVTTSGPSTYGESVTITASLPTGPTGTITLTSGGVTLGSGAVTSTNGIVIVTTASLPVGSDTITASYGGDATNNFVSGFVIQLVGKATPIITLVSSTNPSTLNQSVTFTASLPIGVTGNVIFTNGSANLGTSTLSGGAATITTSGLPAGADTVTATYSGDANNNISAANVIQNVSKTTPIVTVTTSGSTTSGGTVTITATVPPGTTGSITIMSGGVTLGSGTVNPTTGTVTITTTSLPVGSDPITASYGGDSNNNPATGSTTVTITKGSPSETLASSLNPSSPGQSVTFTATLPSGVTGTVTFTNGSTVLGTSTVTSGTATLTTSTLPSGSNNIIATYSGDLNYSTATANLVQTVSKGTPLVTVTTSGSSTYGGTVTITASVPPGTTGTITITSGGVTIGSGTVNPTTGTVTVTTTTLPVGSDPITATYGGDSNNNPATGTTTQIVAKGSATVTLTSSINPSVEGQSVTFVATMSANATGTVTFFDGTVNLGSATLSNGQATIQSSTLAVGSHIITASYGGDSNNGTAISAPLTQIVNKATPVLPPPAVSSSSPPINTPETITETVPPGVTGTVTFSDGTTIIGTATIVGGVATITVPSLPLGSDPITASTSGDANNNPATSPPTLVTVGKAVLVITLTSSANPSPSNVSITFSASTHAGATGLVTFSDGSTILGTGTINSAGVATFATATLAIGSHPITASYGGDSNYSSTSSSVLVEVISKIPTMITITESTPAQLVQTGVTFTATVTATTPNATGTVTFLDGTTIIGTATLTSSGTVGISLTTNANAALLISSLATGSHQITAVYSGDGTFASSTSAPANNNVEDFTNTNTGAATQNIFPGAATSYKFSLAPVGATAFLNDVTVSVAGLPPGSSYTFTPSIVTAGSGVTAVVLNVQTSNSLSARNQMPRNGPSSRNELPIAAGVFGLIGLGAMRKFRHKMPRMLMILLLALGSLLPIAVLSGCAGGYFTLTPTTYSITVTGAEGTVQHAATANLIVQ